MVKLRLRIFLAYNSLYHPNHPKGRNAYAHVAICVKSKFNASYRDIPDEKFDAVLKYIEFLKQNPN